MAPYVVSFLGPDREVLSEEVHWFENDDQALDTIGRSSHPHEIHVRERKRLVARFPTWTEWRR